MIVSRGMVSIPFFCLYYLKQHSPTQARDNKTFIPLIPNN